MMSRIIVVTALVLSIGPCVAQGITAPPLGGPPPVAPTAPATPQIPPAAHVPASALPPLPALPDIGRFPPRVVSWMHVRAAGLARVGEIPNAEDMPSYIRKAGAGILGDMGSYDIEAIAFLVLMMAAQETQEDLKSIMKKIKEANAARERSETGEPDEMASLALRLQNLMERRSKILTTMSNVQKKPTRPRIKSSET